MKNKFLRRGRNYGPRRKRYWSIFALWIVILVIPLYLIGLELWQAWGLVLTVAWIRWCTKMD